MSHENYIIAKSFRVNEEIEKGFLTPVKGIKGGAITRRFPDFTSSGKRQLAAKKAQRASDSSLESASRLRSAQENASRNAASAAASRVKPKSKKPYFTDRQIDPKYDARDR